MIQLIENLLVIKNFGPTARNVLKLSMLSGTLFWRYLNSSFISGHVRSLLCMRYHTAWFASIVHCNVKKAIVALWRATLCSVPSFSDWWSCMETCLTQGTRRSPSCQSHRTWRRRRPVTDRLCKFWTNTCTLKHTAVFSHWVHWVLNYRTFCIILIVGGNLSLYGGNTFTRELLRGKIMKNRSAFWQRKIIPQMRIILALG